MPKYRYVKVKMTEEEALVFLAPVLSQKPGQSFEIDKRIQKKIRETFPEMVKLIDGLKVADNLVRAITWHDKDYRQIGQCYYQQREPLRQQEKDSMEKQHTAEIAYLNGQLAKAEITDFVVNEQQMVVRKVNQ